MKASNIVAFSIGPIFAAFASLITLPFVAWFFSVEDVGRLTMLQVAVGLSVSLFSLQMHQAYVREYHEHEDKALVFKLAVVPGLYFLLLYFIVIMMLPISMSKFLFDIESGEIALMLNITIFTMYFVNFFAHVVRMEERGIAFSISQALPRVMLIILIVFIYIFNLPNNFNYLMIMNLLASVSSFLVLAWLTRNVWTHALLKKSDNELLIQMLKFSTPLIIGGLAYWGLTTIDRLFLRHYSGFKELGIYAVASALGAAVMVVSSIFSNLWHPTVYKWIHDGIEIDKLRFVMEIMVVFVALIWSGFGFFSWILLYFLPEEYVSVEYLVISCAAAPLLYMLSEVTMVGIGVTRKSIYSMYASVLALLTCLVLNYFFVPMYGALASALSLMASFFIFLVIRTESGNRLWVSIPRSKLYFVIFLYMGITTSLSIFNDINFFYKFIWVFAAGLTLFLYRNSLLKFLQLISNKREAI